MSFSSFVETLFLSVHSFFLALSVAYRLEPDLQKLETVIFSHSAMFLFEGMSPMLNLRQQRRGEETKGTSDARNRRRKCQKHASNEPSIPLLALPTPRSPSTRECFVVLYSLFMICSVVLMR